MPKDSLKTIIANSRLANDSFEETKRKMEQYLANEGSDFVTLSRSVANARGYDVQLQVVKEQTTRHVPNT